MLAAVFMSTVTEETRAPLGEKKTSDDPTSAPRRSAPKTSRMARRVDTCCCLRPGTSRPALILVTWIALAWMTEKATAVLRICPPPSPKQPSTSITSTAYDGSA